MADARPRRRTQLGQGKPSRKQPRGPQTRNSAPHLTLPRQKPGGRNRSSTTGKEASPPAAVEARLNSPATGAPSISGTAEVEEALTSGVADEDGLDNADFTHQWQAGRLYMGRFSVGMARTGVVL